MRNHQANRHRRSSSGQRERDQGAWRDMDTQHDGRELQAASERLPEARARHDVLVPLAGDPVLVGQREDVVQGVVHDGQERHHADQDEHADRWQHRGSARCRVGLASIMSSTVAEGSAAQGLFAGRSLSGA